MRTADLLERAGVAHIGTFRTAAERRRPVILTTADGVRVGVVAGTFGTNGFPLPTGREWSVSLWDAPNLLAQARAARRAGADVVVVHLHGGDEYSHQPNAAQVALVERLTRSPDVDLVLGEHAHVVQPITKVHGKWVVYGMGNMVAQQEPSRPDTYQGILVRFTFTERRSGRFAVTRAAYAPIGWNVWRPRHATPSASYGCTARPPTRSRRTSRGWAGSRDCTGCNTGRVLSLELALALRAAGVVWHPAPGDAFVVPDHDLDEHVFVLSDMVIQTVEVPDGPPILAFNGTTEWAARQPRGDRGGLAAARGPARAHCSARRSSAWSGCPARRRGTP